MKPVDSNAPRPSPWLSVRRVFGFFFFLGRRTGRARVFFLLGLIPVALAVMVRILLAGRAGEAMSVFNDILMVFYLQFYVVILALFYGTSVLAEDIEGRTMAYLVTRPVSKPSVVVGKYAAYSALMAVMTEVSLTLSFFIMNSGRIGEASLYRVFFGYAGVLALAILAYTGLFTFLGSLLKRALLVGLVFGFGWENVIQYFPGSTQKFSIVHYLKSLLPRRPVAGRGTLSVLLFRLEPTATLPAILVLVLLGAVCVGLACWLFRTKEYLPEE
jgi:ABC-2 type transport system permease protein